MTSSGTEATMSAIRLARAVTGRDQVLKFAGAYHGHVDGLLAQAGSGLATQGIPASPGVTGGAAAATVIAPWNNPEALLAATRPPRRLAAIIVEPVPANMGVVPPGARASSSCCASRPTRRGALLIFDEVISGLPRRPRRRPGALRGAAGPDDHGQDHRRRPARGRLRRLAAS